MHLSVEQVAKASGGPLATIERTWPLLVLALQCEGIDTLRVEQGAMATIMREASRWIPMGELYPHGWDPREWFEDRYGPQTRSGQQLGNIESGDGFKYRGRGFIQLTGRANYRRMGERLGLDLETFPDRAREDVVAARIFAAYFKDRGVAAAAERGDWEAVQRLVNGGLVNVETFALGLRRLGVAEWSAGRTFG